MELALALKARLTGLDPKGRPFWIGLAASSGLVATYWYCCTAPSAEAMAELSSAPAQG